jgi:twitching motility protein PilT
MEQLNPSTRLGKLLDWCSKQKATDLHAQADRRYSIRIDGKLERIPEDQSPVPNNDEIMSLLRESFSSSMFERIERQHEMDFSFLCAGSRYRANFSKQQGKQSFSFRVVPQNLMKFQDLGLPATILDLVREPRGLLMVVGAAGQGKSTTVRAILQKLNETLALRVITIEDPIEYLFQEDKCQYKQREVGVDSHIKAAVNEGMHSFDQYLKQLLQSGYVTEDTARHYANNWSMVEMEMRGFIPTTSGILKAD